jgi:hypothetical protein
MVIIWDSVASFGESAWRGFLEVATPLCPTQGAAHLAISARAAELLCEREIIGLRIDAA